jgi:hypothetical protein
VTLALSASPQKVDPGITRVLRRVCSFPALLSVAFIVLAVLTVRARISDPDMWWHLKTGQIIWTTHTIPTTDTFSYTTNHHAYVPHEWLSQLLIYGAYRMGGYPGLMLWLCFFTSALLISGYILCSLYSGNSKVAFMGAMTIWLFATIGLAIRPHIIGYLLLVFELLVLHLGRARNPRWFLALPLLFAIWVNCHGSFLLGLILAGTFLFSSFFEFHAGLLVAERWDLLSQLLLGLALLLSIAALFLNPIGVKQVLYPVDTMLHLPMNLTLVQEWRPLQLNTERGVAWLIILACIGLLVIVRRVELLWHELLVLALAVWLSASHERMLFVFGILAAPILSRLLASSWEGYNPEQDLPWANAALIAASLLFVFWMFPSRQKLLTQVNQQNPVKAVEFIRSRHLSGPILNDYGYGGYLIWAAPEYPVFIDGRGDVFEWTGVFQDYEQWFSLQSDPRQLLNKYGVSLCLISRESPMNHVLPLLHEWKLVYSDETSVIYVRATASDRPS